VHTAAHLQEAIRTDDTASTTINEANQESETYRGRQRRESHCQSTDAPPVGARRLPLAGAQLQQRNTVAFKGPGYRRATEAWSLFMGDLAATSAQKPVAHRLMPLQLRMKGVPPVLAA
jgi:hypothetical protein